jgi:putative transposase
MQTFFYDADYAAYRALAAVGCKAARVEVLAYCLMPNHVHFIVVPSSSDGLRRALAGAYRRYTGLINRRQNWQGHLWQERFHSFPLDEEHLIAAVRYVEHNPVRARLAAAPEDWKWSSAAAHISGASDALVGQARPPPLDRICSWPAFLATGATSELGEQIRRHIQNGKPLGSDGFVTRLERLTGLPLRARAPGRPRASGATQENGNCPA